MTDSIRKSNSESIHSFTLASELLFFFGIASIAILPYWLQRYAIVGTAFGQYFESNHFHLPVSWHLADGSVLLLTIAVTICLFAANGLTRFLGGKACLLLRSAAPIAFVIYCIATYRFVGYKAYARFAAADESLGFGDLLDANFVPSISQMTDAVLLVLLGIFLVAISFRYWKIVNDTIKSFLFRLLPVMALVGFVMFFNNVASFAKLGYQTAIDVELRNVGQESGTARKSRVLWIIFDAMDMQLAFSERHASVKMPNFDSLKNRSLSFEAARSPRDGTMLSISSYLTGTVVADAIPEAGNLKYRFPGEKNIHSLATSNTIFHQLASDDFASAVVAQALDHGQITLPYCRMFGEHLTRCWNEGRWAPVSVNIIGNMATVLARLGSYFDPGFLGPATTRQQRVRDGAKAYEAALKASRIAVSDPQLDFVFGHFVLPHPPYIYDRHQDRFAFDDIVEPIEIEGYRGNLELADRTLGQILDDLRSSGLDRTTAIVVTADHGLNTENVPLLISMPGESNGQRQALPVGTVGLRYVVKAILDESAVSYADVDRILRLAPEHADVINNKSGRKAED